MTNTLVAITGAFKSRWAFKLAFLYNYIIIVFH